MAISFLHAADIHLDSPLQGLERYEGAPVERIRRATRRAFSRLIDLAIEKRVDFVLIAGDLYDGDWRDYNTGIYLARELGRLRDLRIPVFVIAGNHDAANKMTRILRLPDNARILAHERPETVRLDDLDVIIHGQSFAKAAVMDNLAAAYPPPVAGCINIGLLHTGLGGAPGHERYAPCTLEDLRLRGYDYWALGHIHAREVLCNDPPVVFAGNVQGRHIRETGPKGCVLATVRPDQTIEHVFHRLDQARWERALVDLSEIDTESDLLDRAAATLDGLLASELDTDAMLAVRVILSGATALHSWLHANSERLVAEVRSVATGVGGDRLWIEKIKVQTRPTRALTMPEGPIEELMEVVEQFRVDPGSMQPIVDELAELKRRLPVELLNDPDSPRLDENSWLRNLLGEIQPLLLDLLLKSQNRDSNSRSPK
jgi:DNA repair exonuclease SbcCD nuclease subunit